MLVNLAVNSTQFNTIQQFIGIIHLSHASLLRICGQRQSPLKSKRAIEETVISQHGKI